MFVRLNWLKVHASDWMRRDDGATALEYGALVVGIVVALVAGAIIFGGELQAFFEGLFPNVITDPAPAAP